MENVFKNYKLDIDNERICVQILSMDKLIARKYFKSFTNAQKFTREFFSDPNQLRKGFQVTFEIAQPHEINEEI